MRLLVVTVAVLLAAPAAAEAGTIGRNGSTLVYMANAGERNGVTFEAASPTIVLVTDGGAGVDIADGANCFPIDSSNPRAGAQCPVDANTMLVTQLGDGDDRYLGEEGLQLPELVSGGAGDDVIGTSDGQDGIDGGDGNDELDGGPGDDTLLGRAGNDLVRGGAGTDRIAGESGTNRLDGRTGGGNDTIDCTNGVSDAVIRSQRDELIECGPAPRASLRVPRQRVRDFFDEDGFDFTVNCARPCAVRWEIVPRDRSTRRRIHDRKNRLDRESPRRDDDGFPRYLDAGRNEFHAIPRGSDTKRDIAAARLLRLRLNVTVIDRNSLEVTLTRDLTIRR